MQLEVILVLAFSASSFGATVGEFPFEWINDTDIEDNFTMAEELNSNFTEADYHPTESTLIINDSASTEKGEVWTPESSPIFRVIRDFLFQARDGLLEPITVGPMDEKTEQMIKVLEQGLIEATTLQLSQMDSATFPTTPLKEDKGQQTFLKRKGEVPMHDEDGNKSKRQTGSEMISVITSSCTFCYDDLQSCVQKCFSTHNCNDIERSARECPPPPSRLCNPFTPWSPVDECQRDEDCNSPALCCNDGCVNKCAPGVWRA